jgi:hypothetical protein
VTEDEAKSRLADVVEAITVGETLLLLADILKEDYEGRDATAQEAIRDACGALIVLGLGLDALFPGLGRDDDGTV